MAETAQAAAATEKKVKARVLHAQIHHGDHEKMIKKGEEFTAPESQVDRLVELGAAELVVDKPPLAAVVTK